MKGAAIKTSNLYFSRGAGTNRAGQLQRKEGAYYLDTLLIYHYFLIIIYCLINALVIILSFSIHVHVGEFNR